MSDNIVTAASEALKALTEAIKTGVDITLRFRDRKNAAAQTNWALVHAAAVTAQEVVANHLKAVRVVVNQAREGDLQGTAALMRQFVANNDLPNTYDALHGELNALIDSKKFPAEANEAMRTLKKELGAYQHEAFLIGYDAGSWGIRDIVQQIADLSMLNQRPDRDSVSVREQIEKLAKELQGKDAWRHLRAPLSNPDDKTVSDTKPESTAEMTEVVRTWMDAWERDVEVTLYGTTGVNHFVGMLVTMSNMAR
ncbi:hypothetical protein [Paraburkholderia sp.]|jgi:hypothetical protein|uniref:hypothetical protein n=1 Tax=Paraburkholderia sp. TaxID=1926495 RepID=UPI003C7CA4AC